jgi:hypothetical protein
MIGSMRGVIIGAALASSVGFGTGWLVNGWRLGEQISQREAEDAKQEQQELLDALAERDANAARNEELSVQLAQAREDIRTEIRYIEREVPIVVQDNPVCRLGSDAVSLLNAAATGDRSPRPRSPRRRPAAEVPGGSGDDDPD